MFGTNWIVTPPDNLWTDSVPIAFGSVRWYAIFIMLGFIVAIVAAGLKMWWRYKVPVDPMYWFILICVPISLLGANFGSCVLGEPAGKPWSQFWSHFGEGLAVEWGVLFAVIAGFIYFPLITKINKYRVKDIFHEPHQVEKVSMWIYLDAIIPCVLVAQFMGRWGNYMNQEVYGAPVTSQGLAKFLHDCLPYSWIVNPEHGSAGYYQPLFFWEGIGNLAMFFILYFGLEFFRYRKAGDMSAAYFVWYGVFRLCLEPLRDPNYKSHATMVFSGIFVAAGVVYILLNHLVIAKVRDKKIWHTLFSRGPGEVFRMVGAGWNKENLKIRYQDKQFEDCVRKPAEMIYFGEW